MVEGSKLFRKLDLKRIIAIIVVLAIIASISTYYIIQKNKPTEVLASSLKLGEISSKMFVKAQVKPSSVVSQTIKQKQKILKLNVKAGDQVVKGELLMKLDISENTLLYEQAKKARIDIEISNAKEKKSAQEQADQAVKDQIEYEKQVNNLSGSLGRIITNIALLGTSSVDTATLQEELGRVINEQLADFDPNAPDVALQTQELVNAIISAINVSGNPQNPNVMNQINKDIAIFSQALPKVLTGLGGNLTSNVTSGISLTDSLTKQLQSLGLGVTDPLAQAISLENSYKKILDESVTEVFAQISGIVAEVNVQEGGYIGTSQTQSNNSLDGILSGALGSSGLSELAGLSSATTNAKAPIIIYDNTKPKAVFQVSQFDSAKLELGMKVEYIKDNINFKNSYAGKIIYKSPFVLDSSLASGGASDLLKSAGLVSALGSEPQLLIEMSLEGDSLTDITLGFLIDAEILTASASNVILLPAQSMRKELDEYYVFVVGKDNVISKKPFTPGIQSDMFVEAKSGLSAGDLVVENPTNSMKAGDKVRVKGAN